MRYVTAKEMKELDRAAIEKYGIPAGRLMENAGRAAAEEAMKCAKRGGVFVFCGYGNNGGDGFVAARYLTKNSYNTFVFLAGKPRPFSEESKANFEAVMEAGCKPQVMATPTDIDRELSNLNKPDIVIDAIFGIGMKGSLDDFYIRLIEKINSIGAPIVSVDIPSGLDSDTGEPLPVAVKAVKTVTLGLPKVGFKNPKAKLYTGEVVVADIGLPKSDAG